MASPGEGSEGSVSTLTFESFWGWLIRHPNCIYRAGTPEAALFDDDDLHWHFAAEGPSFYVQVMRGKRLMGELLIEPERVSYVEALGEEREGEYVFQLVRDAEGERFALYYFVLSHGFDEAEPAENRRSHSVH
jgi:hypothetical protein